MTAEQFRAALADRSLSIAAAAILFNVNRRTAQRWASEEQDIPRAVAIALELMIRFKVDPRTLGGL